MQNIENTRDIELNNANTSIKELQDECTKLKQENKELAAKVAWYEEQIRKGMHQKYKPSSEKTPEQLTFFNEAEKNQRKANHICGYIQQVTTLSR